MRTSLSTALALALVCPVSLVVACTSEQRGYEEVEETFTSELPLSPACGDCAQEALAGVCSDVLQECVNTPDCMDVSSCLDACSPDDVQCFAGCAAASAKFAELVDCVLCNECGQECSNDWSCGPNDPPDPPDPVPTDCAQCLLEASSDECQAVTQECVASSECVEAVNCVGSCGLTDACAQQCLANSSDEVVQQVSLLYQCAYSAPCDQVCTEGGQDPDDQPPPNDDCNTCAQDSINGACADATNVCLQTDGCQEGLQCMSECQDPNDSDCQQACWANTSDAAIVAANGLIECAYCDACPDQCDTQNMCP